MAQIITFILFGGLGAMLLVVGIQQQLQQHRNLARAEPVLATVIQSRVFASTSMDADPALNRSTSTTTYRPEVRFAYRVAGRDHESDLIHPNGIVRTYASHAAAAQVLAPFPLRARVQAHVDRAQPDKAFLIAEATKGPLVFVVLGLLLPPLAWFVGGYL